MLPFLFLPLPISVVSFTRRPPAPTFLLPFFFFLLGWLDSAASNNNSSRDQAMPTGD
jgi:hypothetical protein